MSPLSPKAQELKAELDKLIDAASNFEFDILKTIYHDDMKIYMIGEDNELHISDKAGFIDHVTKATEAAVKPNIWAKYHSVEADDTNGHIVISRKVNLTGTERLVTLSIDFVFEDSRWQITREIIVVQKGN